MTDYTAAPATSLLATNCLCCGRPLLDAASVTAGIGPVCRAKHGYTQIDESVRVAANALIHEAALETCDNARRAEIADELEAMGADVLAAKIRDRFMKPAAKIRREVVTFGKGKWATDIEALVVTTKYNPDFNEALKATIDWRDRSIAFDGKGKFNGWAVKPGAKAALWHVLREQFGGERCQCPDGSVANIPVLVDRDAEMEEELAAEITLDAEAVALENEMEQVAGHGYRAALAL